MRVQLALLVALAGAPIAVSQGTSPTPTPSASAVPTIVATTRYWIDALGFSNVTTDAGTCVPSTGPCTSPPSISAGALFRSPTDTFGTLSATAVLFESPASQYVYSPWRIDIYAALASNNGRTDMRDMTITLYSDDGTPSHNPALPLSPATDVGQYAQWAPQLYTSFASWWQILLNGTWPALTPQTYYHVVLAPGSPLTGALPNGVYWSGIPYGTPQVTTSASVHGDPLLFTARQLVSQPSTESSSAAFGAASAAAVAYLRTAANWSSLGPRLTSWTSAPQARYGLQVVATAFGLASATPTGSPSPSLSASPSMSPSASASKTSAATLTGSATATASASPSSTATSSATATASSTSSASATPTASATATGSATSSSTATRSATGTRTSTRSGTSTRSSTRSSTRTSSATATRTGTSTSTGTGSATSTHSSSSTSTSTGTSSSSASSSSSATASASATASSTASSSASSTATASLTATATGTTTLTVIQFTLWVGTPVAVDEFVQRVLGRLEAALEAVTNVPSESLWVSNLTDHATGASIALSQPGPSGSRRIDASGLRSLQAAAGSLGYDATVNAVPRGGATAASIIASVNAACASRSPDVQGPLADLAAQLSAGYGTVPEMQSAFGASNVFSLASAPGYIGSPSPSLGAVPTPTPSRTPAVTPTPDIHAVAGAVGGAIATVGVLVVIAAILLLVYFCRHEEARLRERRRAQARKERIEAEARKQARQDVSQAEIEAIVTGVDEHA